MNIGEWLLGLGLPSYEQAFRDNGVDLKVLPRLTGDDLKEIGVAAVGDRRKILDAIAALASAPLPAAVVAAAGPPPHAERRQVTIMFVDLAGSTELSRRIDPEELGEILRTYQNGVAGEITRFEGHVAKFMGDGVLAYFGWPRANEDGAERAVRAGLAIAVAVGRLPVPGGEKLAARVGIATGLVVIGDLIGEGAAQEEAVTGETPNLAARLQTLAAPGTVVIADSTRRLLGGLFELSGLGASQLKGFADPVPAWRVVGESGVESRFEALHGTELTPLVGRGEELDLILSRWRQAKNGGQVVLISGEPGIGKSRLVLAVRERLEAEPKKLLNFACSPHHINSALFPFVTQLERAARLAGDDTPESKLDRLERLLGEAASAPEDAVALVADLLGIPIGTRRTLPALAPLQKKAALFRTFLSQIEGLAARDALLMVVEDAHWLDPTSRELVDQIVDRIERLPVLLIVSFRPELPPPWIGLPHVTLLTINRLPQGQMHSLVERVTGGKPLPPEVLAQILARTEGVPLFAEELTKVVLESGIVRNTGKEYVLAGPLLPLAIPATLHDSLMARLDRLAPVKEVAQIGACIGREFSLGLLAAVVPLPEAEVVAALERLVEAGLVFRRGIAPDTTYIFKHLLVRDVAYESLLRRRRQELHARIATAIETRFPQIVDTQPELVAHHFNEAGLWEQAGKHWLAAGRRATARSSNVEAIAHLKAGVDAVLELPASDARLRLELPFQLALGASLIATKGFASSEAEAAYQRALDLSGQLNEDADHFIATRGLGFVNHVRGRLPEAGRLADEGVALARRRGDPAVLVEAYFFKGSLEFHAGAFQSSYDWIQKSLEQGGGQYYSEAFGFNHGVFCRVYAAHCDWHLGHLDRALRTAEEGLALARQSNHPFTIALAPAYVGMFHQFRREPELVLKLAEEARAHCVEHRFEYYRVWSGLLIAWTVAALGRIEEGLAAYDAALKEFRGTGSEIRLPHYLGALAAIYRSVGRKTAALRYLAEAAAIAKANAEHWSDSELEREHGEALLVSASSDGRGQAAASFRQAIKIAKAQSARLPELRATASLARLLAESGDRRQAADLFGPICSWFTEGLDTKDICEARELLASLQ